MPPRLNKRQQREQEELAALAAAAPSPILDNEEVESGEENQPEQAEALKNKQKNIGFAALFPADDHENDDDDSANEAAGMKPKARKSKKKKKSVAAPPPAALTQPTRSTPNPQSVDPPTKKALKKAEARKKKAAADEIDKALAEIALTYPSTSSLHASSSKPTTSTSSQRQPLAPLLAVSLPHLDPQSELRKFFGSKVVQANKPTPSSSASPHSARGRNNKAGGVVRSNLTRPKDEWWPAARREGLTLRALGEDELALKGTGEEGEKWWTVEYSRKYKSVTMAFMRTVLSGDPEGFWNLLGTLPWHADTLLQLSEVYRHREEYASAFDFVERALFTYERSFLGASFNFTTGLNRLDFDRVENRPFFLAVHRQVADLTRRGLLRTSFEFARLMYALDPARDPHGALFHLEYLAVKSGMREWLLGVWDHHESKRQTSGADTAGSMSVDPSLLPGWTFSRALALWMGEKERGDEAHHASTAALKDAVKSFPPVVPLLADKLDVSLPASIRSHRAFKITTDSISVEAYTPVLHLLCHFYVQRAFSLWKEPDIASWFTTAVTAEFTNLPSTLGTTDRYDAFNRKYVHPSSSTDSPASGIYRHLLVLESSYRRLFSFVPAEVLNRKSFQCDPLPPLGAVTSYDDEFFQGITGEDAEDERLRTRPRTRREREMEQRMLARLIPDAAIRRQLQAIFDAHPRLANRFPGGIVPFAQMAVELPMEDFEEMIMIDEAVMANEIVMGGMPGGAMPGAMPDEHGFPDLLDVSDSDGEVDVEHGDERRLPAGDGIGDGHDEDEEDGGGGTSSDEDDAPVAPLPIRMLRNVMNRFWGGTFLEATIPDYDSSSDEDGNEVETSTTLPVNDGGGVD